MRSSAGFYAAVLSCGDRCCTVAVGAVAVRAVSVIAVQSMLKSCCSGCWCYVCCNAACVVQSDVALVPD